MTNLEQQKTPVKPYKYYVMQSSITTQQSKQAEHALSYEVAAAEILKESKEVNQESSCSLQLKNLLKTNLKLLKLNEIKSLLLF